VLLIGVKIVNVFQSLLCAASDISHVVFLKFDCCQHDWIATISRYVDNRVGV
jgi:hypothetical protein